MKIPTFTQNIAYQITRLSSIKLEKGAHITRYFMYKELSKLDLDQHCEKVLSISHSQNLCQILGIPEHKIIDAIYPDINWLDLPFADNSFDCIVSDQVLEHVEGDPFTAIKEGFRVLKPGGYAVHTTCFINPVHECPKDFWRFTPAALEMMTTPYAEVIESNAWGNAYVWAYSHLGLRFFPIPNASWHPLNRLAIYNDKDWPIVTWVIARKK